MATAPTSRRLNLTRDQLASFLTDQQQIRQFELLLTTIDALTGENVAAGQVYAGPPIGSGPPTFRALQKSDLPASSLTDLDDVDVTTVVDGQLLRYDATTEKWVNSEGLTASSNGIVTANALLVTAIDSFGGTIEIDGQGNAILSFVNSVTGISSSFLVTDTAASFISPKIELYSSDDFLLHVGGVERLKVLAGTGILDLSTDRIRIRNNRTPASATATGTKGDICWDANYIYVCVATNTWKRTAISTW
jgi:hypothetical protein